MDSYVGLYKTGKKEIIGMLKEYESQDIVSILNKDSKTLLKLLGVRKYYTLPLTEKDIEGIKASERPSLKSVDSILCRGK
jgi:hypothetical protein